MSIIFYRKKAAAAAPVGDNYTWRHRFTWAVADTAIASPLNSANGFESLGQTLTYVATDGAMYVNSNRLEWSGDPTIAVNENYVQEEVGYTTHLAQTIAIRGFDLRSGGGAVHIGWNNVSANFHQTNMAGGFRTRNNTQRGLHDTSNAPNYSVSSKLLNSFDLVLMRAVNRKPSSAGQSFLKGYISSEGSSSAFCGFIMWIKSRTGTDFPSWRPVVYNAGTGVNSSISTTRIGWGCNMTNNGTSVYMDGFGEVDIAETTMISHFADASYCDRFTDVASTLLTSHAADRNITWSGGNWEISSSGAVNKTPGFEIYDTGGTDGAGHSWFKSNGTKTGYCYVFAFRYYDANNFYAIRSDVSQGGHSLVKVEAGTETVLAGPIGSCIAGYQGYMNITALGNDNVHYDICQIAATCYTTTMTYTPTATYFGMYDEESANFRIPSHVFVAGQNNSLSAAWDNLIADLA